MIPPSASPVSLASRDPLVYIRDLTKRYARLTALSGVSSSIRAGEVLGLISPNGSGKTTLERLLDAPLGALSKGQRKRALLALGLLSAMAAARGDGRSADLEEVFPALSSEDSPSAPRVSLGGLRRSFATVLGAERGGSTP